jgi:hypothetical protein
LTNAERLGGAAKAAMLGNSQGLNYCVNSMFWFIEGYSKMPGSDAAQPSPCGYAIKIESLKLNSH